MIDPTHVTKDRKTTQWLLTGAFILWLVFTISSYFVVNKPVLSGLTGRSGSPIVISSATPGALAQALLDLGAAAWITLVALGIGTYLWQWLIDDANDATLTLVFATGLGFGVLGLLTLALGLAGFISRPVFIAVLALLTLLTGPNTIRLLRRLRWKRPPLLIGLYLSFSLGMVLTLALLPPTSWDGLSYHLNGPKLYLLAGRINPGIDILPLNYPSLFEMLFLMGMGLRNDIVAKLIHFVFMLLLGGSVSLIGSKILEIKNGWLAPIFLFSTPLVLVTAAWAYNDLALSFYGLCALYTFLRWRSSANNRWLLMSGLCSGLMMSMKYTAVIPAVFFTAMIAWHFRHSVRRSVQPLLLFTGPATAVVMPWLLKNWAFTGNPIYPFIFHGRFWDEFRAAEFGSPGTGIGFDPLALFRLPYVMTLGYADSSQEATIGPFYLVFLPLILAYGLTKLRHRVPSAFNVILAYSLISYLFWTVGVINSAHLFQARFLLPGIVALCPVLAWVLEDLSHFNHPVFSLQRFMRMVAVFVIALLVVSQLDRWLQAKPVAYLSGAETRATYLQQNLGAHFDALSTINTELDSAATIEFLWEPRSYYCDLDCRPDTLLDRFEHLHLLHGTAEAIVAGWRQDQVTHVLLYDTGFNYIAEHSEDPLTREEVALMQTIRDQYLHRAHRWDDSYTLYRLDE